MKNSTRVAAWLLRAGRCRAPGCRGRGIAATGSFSCGGSVLVKPSLTKMIDLRPSRSPPSRTAAPLSAPIDTSLRICSTVAAG